MLPEIEEDLCLRCHGSPALRARMEERGLLRSRTSLRDISDDFKLPSRHPIERTGLHRGDEELPERNPRARRHVECVDCHRAHRTVRTRPSERLARLPRRSSLDGVSPEYQLCYRCHSDSVNLPRDSSNIRLRFLITNRSFHPVEAAGRGRWVPSLRSPLTVNSMISCGDCHGNDTGRGVHGSAHRFLLRKHYATAQRVTESPFAYALCYSCHDRNALYSGRGFPHHERHVKDGRIPCISCHNAHGSPTFTSLIEFKSDEVSADRTYNRLHYQSLGPGNGVCYLTCHGENHPGRQYCARGASCSGSASPPVRVVPLRERLRDSPFSF